MRSRILRGAVAGLVAGGALAVLMSAMAIIDPTDGHFVRVITLLALVVGSDRVIVGWLVHLAVSAVIGAIFGGLVGRWAQDGGSAAVLGAGYGIAWWIVGWLGGMAFVWGFRPSASAVTESMVQIAFAGLLAGLGCGVILGAVFAGLARRASVREQPEPFRRVA